MSVPEVVTFASGMTPILKHFKLSGKSSALLQQCLEIMDMKPFKLMTWCPTRMANLLECSARTLKILFLICVMLARTGVKEEEASFFRQLVSVSSIWWRGRSRGSFCLKIRKKTWYWWSYTIRCFQTVRNLCKIYERS